MNTTATTITAPKNRPATRRDLGRQDLGDRGEDEGAEHRPEDRSGAAEHGDDDHLDVEPDVEGADRVDEGDPVGVDAAGQRADRRRQRERKDLVARRVDAHRRCGLLVLADRDQPVAEAAVRDPRDDQRRDDDQRQRQLVEQHVAAQQRQHQPRIAPGDLEIRDDRRHHLGESQRADREVVAAQAQDRAPEQRREDDRDHRAEYESDAERKVPAQHRDRGAVAAEAVEHRIAERRVAGVAADDVPALGQRREQQHVDAELHDAGRREPRYAGQHHQRRGEASAGERTLHVVLPNRPVGRTISTSTRMPKLATSV